MSDNRYFLLEIQDDEDNMLFRSLVEADRHEEVQDRVEKILSDNDCGYDVHVSILEQLTLEELEQRVVLGLALDDFNI